MTDVLGNALLDYQNGHYTEDIVTFSSLNEKDVIPLPYLFRAFRTMPPLEQKAMEMCKGKILDIGSGAGSHSLYLQKKGCTITALDNSKGAVQTCKLRGVENVIHTDIYNFKEQKFNTLLLLMNGIGLAGKLKNLNRFFSHLKSLLKTNGQILLDSSDIIYMFEEDMDGGYWIPDTNAYYGEVEFTMQYKGEKSSPFYWLYVDYNTLQRAANANNLTCELLFEGEHYDYLARLTVKG